MTVEVIVTTIDDTKEPCLTAVKSIEKTMPPWASLKVLVDKDHIGSAGMMDRVFKEVKNDFIFLHDDMRVKNNNWYEEFCQYARRLPKAAMLAGKLVFPNGLIQQCGAQLMHDGSVVPIGRGSQDLGVEYSVVRDVPFTSFGGCYFRREAINRIGSIDPRFFPAHFEDADCCIRFRQAGYRIIFVPIEIEHQESFQNTAVFGSKQAKIVEENHKKFVEKWKIKTYGKDALPDWW